MPRNTWYIHTWENLQYCHRVKSPNGVQALYHLMTSELDLLIGANLLCQINKLLGMQETEGDFMIFQMVLCSLGINIWHDF